MSKKTTKEKKLRRQKNKEENVKQEQVSFDVLSILRENDLETKPKVGDFLKKYVKSIRIFVQHSKIMIYPVNTFEIGKVFIDFLDGHQIISDFSKSEREYWLYNRLEEIKLKDKELKLIVMFVQKLQEFQFIHN